MPKYGENIYHRKDGRWEARYIAMRLPNGKAKYKSVYGRTHDIAKKKQLAAMQALTHESTAACELTLKELFSQYLLQTDVKLSTRERYGRQHDDLLIVLDTGVNCSLFYGTSGAIFICVSSRLSHDRGSL